jgi:hypothetical protein
MARILADIIQIVFPHGTNADGRTGASGGVGTWDVIPQVAADVFAFSAYVIQMTGLMGFFDPNPEAPQTFFANEPLKVVLSSDDGNFCRKQSEQWQTNGVPSVETAALWGIVFSSIGLPFSVSSYQRTHKTETKPDTMSPAPEWWAALFKLMIIADEACEGIGHVHPNPSDPLGNKAGDLRLFVEKVNESRKRERETSEPTGLANAKRAFNQVDSLTLAADPSVICIQPKGRVTSVGCSLRNMSRNLSVTGPRGSVRCSWQQLAKDCTVQSRKTLNLLVIPTPYELMGSNFSSKVTPANDQWGVFHLDQKWLENSSFEDAMVEIVKAAVEESSQINGIIFPEISLNFVRFSALMSKLFAASNSTLEFMIAGSSSNCDGETGNFVLTAIWERNLTDTALPDWFRIVSQRKHHRWKLDRQQIATYGLGSSLSPSKDWWEDHDIRRRELNFFQFRHDAVFASLICEDLARNDPCHDIIRSVAPNLVFALLMDGPQLNNRWPARYAGSLADDPGCTVLTATSFGLIDRSNDHWPQSKSLSVGLLRDSQGSTTEIVLPNGKDAVLVTLGSEKTEDRTLDGRKTTNASKWYYVSQRPISAGARNLLS